MNKKKFVIITGASGGIGQSLCKAFSEEGYQVIAIDRSEPKENLYCAHFFNCDLEVISEDLDYAELFKSRVIEALGQNELSCLVNNAAVQILGGASSLTRRDWNKTLSINLLAPFYLINLFYTQLKASKGSVINISSIHAKQTKPNFVAYATSKAALTGLTKALAVDVGVDFRVNAIEPAAIETDMLRAGFNNDVSCIDALRLIHPCGRIGRVDEVSRLCVFLADSDNNFLSGSIIALDGAVSSRLHDVV